jgi:GntR family transcriptional regulator
MTSRGSVDRSSPLPLWTQVHDDLRARLSGGEFSDRFPTDNELVDQYGVSRQTVREAVRRLSDAGLIERRRGLGTRVRAFEHVGGSLESLYVQIESQGSAQRSVVRARGRVVDAAIAARLGLEPAAPLVHVERLRLADDEPLALDRAWLPEPIGDALLAADLTHTGLYVELLRSSGIDIDGGTEWIRPVLPSPDDRRTLELPRGTAAFSIERLTRAGRDPVEWRHTLVRGDRYTITLEASRAPGRTALNLPWSATPVQ